MKTKSQLYAFGLVLGLMSAIAHSATVQVEFTAVIDTIGPSIIPGTQLPEVGTNFSGSYVFDYDPQTYTLISSPGEGVNYAGYVYSGMPYGFSTTLPGGPTSTGNVTIEVFDNGSLVPANQIASDTVIYGAKRNGVSYFLALSGSNSTFQGTELPIPAVLSGTWTSRTFFAVDSANRLIGGSVSSISVVPIPEPRAWALLLGGWVLLIAWRRAQRSPR